jgi:hypothetical protein
MYRFYRRSRAKQINKKATILNAKAGSSKNQKELFAHLLDDKRRQNIIQ